ncbi:MAG: isoleucine--tRNA ligase [Deltaproteobacteria bacterium RIFOXYA12_FULL_58_15]|nr:MAG: isoleucine--tRNA ligase [Deltaproteobacteria bacterium RIFOXYA12_FULL_58_15]OGR14997.1 MAG: isoleucine--tRNA ligase [Deltaproteobacteria bacterium RIFOXYB12_FULL_58_9]
MPDYKNTLNLPQTDFAMRAGLAEREPKLLEQWNKNDLYGQIRAASKGKPRFVMHDGPPYANGTLHHGHILNKILKDIVVKDRTMRGFDCGYIPGWDCHGLPIEVQVDKRLGKKKADMSKAEIRKACRAYANEFVGIQREQFQRLGVLGRWQDPYLTMNFGYEATIVRELGRFADTGLLYKGLRPVNWCTTHRTALAEAEVEYDDHTSPSIYVAFALTKLPDGLGQPTDLVIWTTTPWTLPANLAICVHPSFEYVAYPVRGKLRIIARGMLKSFLAAVKAPELDESKIAKTWKGAELEGLTYSHPLVARESPVVVGEHVTLEAGTGCVHTAPGHGPDDFQIGRRYNLGILSPVDNAGRFTEEAGAFAGQKVFDANVQIVQTLVDTGALLNEPGETLTHRYAHCWRCHNPIILRATEQWFVAIDQAYNDGAPLRERALSALCNVSWIPPWGEDRIRGMLEARPDWCLSRQRTWGVPIAVVYCEKCDKPVVDSKRMNRVAELFEREGADAWYTHSIEELMGPLQCECGHKEFRKEEDILDVWFDSGVSYAAVIERLGEGHKEGPPVDLYLEGSDQHRGWFHSALLCGLATRGLPPYRKVLTHGFVVDGKGKKLSKSAGNFVDPFRTIDQIGAEMLRLWVAGEDYREDIRISQEILTRLGDTYRKLRNTVRYLLGNVSDFDPNTQMVPPAEILELDRYALVLTRRAIDKMMHAYDTYEFHQVLHGMTDLCTVELSAFYLDVLKDRLYAFGRDSHARRSAQTALYVIARDLLRLMAPVFSFTAEEAWAYLPRMHGDSDSVHLNSHPRISEPEVIDALWHALAREEEVLLARYQRPREIRKEVNVVLENARKEKRVGSSVEAAVTLTVDPEDFAALSTFSVAELSDLFIVSAVTLEKGDALSIVVDKASGTKCARCWLYRDDVGQSPTHPEICGRCVEAQ